MNDDDRNRDSDPPRRGADRSTDRACSPAHEPSDDPRGPTARPDPNARGEAGEGSADTGERDAQGGPEGAARPEPVHHGDAARPRSDQEPSDTAPTASRTGRQRLVAGLWPPRLSRSQLTVALLLLVLGLGLTIQVRSTSEHSVLRGARQEDLVRILSELDNRTQRLTEEKRSLENQRTELENSSDQAEETVLYKS